MLEGLGNFGITRKKLQDGLAEVNAVEASNLTQEKEKGEAQAATQTRDKALDAPAGVAERLPGHRQSRPWKTIRNCWRPWAYCSEPERLHKGKQPLPLWSWLD